MGRPRKFDTDEALAAARDQFWNHGYAGTSVDDLLAATNLGKGSFYGAFGDKRSLFLRILSDYAAARVAELRELHRRSPRAIDALRMMLRPKVRPRGCLLMNSTFELAPQDADVVAIARETFAAFEQILAASISRAKREGDLPTTTDARQLATTLLAVSQGQECLARTGLSRAGLEGIGCHASLDLLRPAPARDPPARSRSR
jgi:AcrR family transcriptional regulator